MQGQIEELLTFLELHEEEGINICITAGWLHHRFTYIHPFQDANGRVARALVNYLFVKEGLFPVVVDRGQKIQYIDALESADRGDMKALDQLQEFKTELKGGLDVTVNVDSGGTHDGRDDFYRWQVIESVQQADQWANFNEQSRWVRALVRGGTSQLRVVFSFHHVGRALTGVAEVTSIADLEDQGDRGQEGSGSESRSPVSCMLQPFTFTWRDDPQSLNERFSDWCKNSLVVALREWADRL